ncbi:cation:proton antiporter domain-containing protein [Sandaracinobacteroides saxicola]|uniref:Cation:proton antiporter n=1 Tax=Sandaracinobacteroides saxicola TaxID=2759707 RepID=A0A7G5IIZ5_9SPHN|nr:cation:proton antiporter [Sandaracinobacteroides saxicola]QMW23337.1 cation:proton antiporter [Sandaracinobacteroides saxicola]
MQDDKILLAVAGLAVIVAHWVPRLFTRREPSATPLLLLGGMLIGLLLPEVAETIDPARSHGLWERVTEACVIVSLFGTGLRIDRPQDWHRWLPTWRLLLIAMPLTIAAMALGGLMLGLPLASALLLGAMLAPTDPVLASGVQVGKPTEGGEEPVRFALTTEAGLNDGLAFPFVHLAILAALAGGISGGLLGEWALRDGLMRIGVGALAGAAIGWAAGVLLFRWPRGNPLARTEAGVVGLGVVALVYGATELLHGYGFVAAFVAGLMVRRAEEGHEFQKTLHGFADATELSLTALLLLGLGMALPALWPAMGWPALGLAALLVLVVRPAAGWLSLMGSAMDARQRRVTAFYGIRGIGSVYYLAYAAGKAEFAALDLLWGTLALAIILSTLTHGLTAERAVEAAETG